MLPEKARTELRQQLVALSERAMSAQWYDDLEFIVWARLGHAPSKLGNIVLEPDFLAEIASLGQAAGGWFEYSDKAEEEIGDGLIFVTSSDWEAKFAEWLKRVPPEGRPAWK